MTEELVDKIYEAVARLHTLGYNNDYDSIDYYDYVEEDDNEDEEEAQVSADLPFIQFQKKTYNKS